MTVASMMSLQTLSTFPQKDPGRQNLLLSLLSVRTKGPLG